jgi:hypothetical protein
VRRGRGEGGAGAERARIDLLRTAHAPRLDLLATFQKFSVWLDKQFNNLINQFEDVLKQRHGERSEREREKPPKSHPPPPKALSDSYQRVSGYYNALADPAVFETARPVCGKREGEGGKRHPF